MRSCEEKGDVLGWTRSDNTAFPMTPKNIFGIFHTVREYQCEDSTSLYGNKNAGGATEAKTTRKITSPHMKQLYVKSLATTKRGYDGTLNLLTSQGVFDNMFVKKPHMNAAQTNILSNTKNKKLLQTT